MFDITTIRVDKTTPKNCIIVNGEMYEWKVPVESYRIEDGELLVSFYPPPSRSIKTAYKDGFLVPVIQAEPEPFPELGETFAFRMPNDQFETWKCADLSKLIGSTVAINTPLFNGDGKVKDARLYEDEMLGEGIWIEVLRVR